MYSSSDLRFKSDHETDLQKDLSHMMLRKEDSVANYVIWA